MNFFNPPSMSNLIRLSSSIKYKRNSFKELIYVAFNFNFICLCLSYGVYWQFPIQKINRQFQHIEYYIVRRTPRNGTIFSLGVHFMLTFNNRIFAFHIQPRHGMAWQSLDHSLTQCQCILCIPFLTATTKPN